MKWIINLVISLPTDSALDSQCTDLSRGVLNLQLSIFKDVMLHFHHHSLSIGEICSGIVLCNMVNALGREFCSLSKPWQILDLMYFKHFYISAYFPGASRYSSGEVKDSGCSNSKRARAALPPPSCSSWRRSFTSVLTCAATGDLKWLRCSSSLTARLKSGSKTVVWSIRKITKKSQWQSPLTPTWKQVTNPLGLVAAQWILQCH